MASACSRQPQATYLAISLGIDSASPHLAFDMPHATQLLPYKSSRNNFRFICKIHPTSPYRALFYVYYSALHFFFALRLYSRTVGEPGKRDAAGPPFSMKLYYPAPTVYFSAVAH